MLAAALEIEVDTYLAELAELESGRLPVSVYGCTLDVDRKLV